MKFNKLLFLSIIISIFISFSQTWAMHSFEEEESDTSTVLTRKRRFGSLGDESAEPQRSKVARSGSMESPSSESPSSSAPSSSRFSGTPFFARFQAILASKPCPLPVPTRITVTDEDREGSRRWVKSFETSQDQDAHAWHRNMPKVLSALREANRNGRYFDVDTNFAVARMEIVHSDGKRESIELPYFFVSGWPANGNRDSAKKFAKTLADGKLGESFKDYKSYGLRFMTKSYQGSKEETLLPPSYDSYKSEVKSVMKEELQVKSPIPGPERIQIHTKIMESSDGRILAKLYFHSEQAIWMAIKEEIEKRKGSSIKHVIVDICSYYDMCWCCGDTFASCCHTQHLGARVYVRASGCNAYYDQPFQRTPLYALRDHRREFEGYGSGRAFSMPANDNDPDGYRPYIAHSVASDFP